MTNSKWNKTTGSQGINPWLSDQKADIHYLFVPLNFDFGQKPDSNKTNVEYWFIEYKGRPTISQVKQDVHSLINSDTDKRILEDFVYTDAAGKEHKVWLSQENQFNYNAAVNAVQMYGEAVLPQIFKFGTDENIDLYTFTTKEELGQFFVKALKHIQSCIERGLRIKGSIDWELYGKEAKHE